MILFSVICHRSWYYCEEGGCSADCEGGSRIFLLGSMKRVCLSVCLSISLFISCYFLMTVFYGFSSIGEEDAGCHHANAAGHADGGRLRRV